MRDYSLAEVRKLFGLPPGLIRKLGEAGCITCGDPRGRITYSFQDLLILRMAGALKVAKIPSPRIVAALAQIQAGLPPDRELSTIVLAASGKDVAVHDGASEREASGQYALPLRIDEKAADVAHLVRVAPPADSRADDLYRRGHQLEETDSRAACAAYLAALRVQDDHLEARINLGRLLHLDGQLEEAERIYRQAKSESALLSFNLAILLEDLDRRDDAIAAYHDALARDPLLHDAHFNLSRLYEMADRPREALKHLLAYRRHASRFEE